LTLQWETLHIADDTGRIALIDTPTVVEYSEAQLLRYQYSNHIGSVALELDRDADIISYEEYYPFGATSFQSGRSTAEASLKRYRFTGKERDWGTGMYYHGARYYLPWLCRWCAVDPMESKYVGMSGYNYSFNNPVMWNDPSGEDPDEKGSWIEKNGKMQYVKGLDYNQIEFEKTDYFKQGYSLKGPEPSVGTDKGVWSYHEDGSKEFVAATKGKVKSGSTARVKGPEKKSAVPKGIPAKPATASSSASVRGTPTEQFVSGYKEGISNNLTNTVDFLTSKEGLVTLVVGAALVYAIPVFGQLLFIGTIGYTLFKAGKAVEDLGKGNYREAGR